jgi:GxxExxY protein
VAVTELLLKDEVYAIVGAAMTVYNELGWGFLEAVYQEALEIELSERGIPFEAQKELRIIYKGRPLKKTYNCDLLCYGKIMVELKSEERLINKDRGQLLNYLKATGLELGPLLNFGQHEKLEWERWVRSHQFAQIGVDSRKKNG